MSEVINMTPNIKFGLNFCLLRCKIYFSELTRNVKFEKGFLRWANQNTNAKLEKVNFEAFLRHKLPEGRNKLHCGCSQPIRGWFDITIGRLRTKSGAL